MSQESGVVGGCGLRQASRSGKEGLNKTIAREHCLLVEYALTIRDSNPILEASLSEKAKKGHTINNSPAAEEGESTGKDAAELKQR